MNSQNKSKKKTNQRVGNTTSNQIVQQVLKSVERQKQPKYLDDFRSVSGAATGVYYDLSALVTQGTTTNQRIGASIKMKRLTLRGSVYFGDPLQVMRIVIFRWNVSSTTDAPSDDELFDASSIASTQVVYGNPLPLKPSRFHIVKDVTFNLATNWKPIQTLHMEIPLNFDCEYDIGVNTGKNHLYVGYICDSGVVPHPTFVLNSMLHFHDT